MIISNIKTQCLPMPTGLGGPGGDRGGARGRGSIFRPPKKARASSAVISRKGLKSTVYKYVVEEKAKRRQRTYSGSGWRALYASFNR